MSWFEIILCASLSICGIALLFYSYLIYKGYGDYLKMMSELDEKTNRHIKELETLHKHQLADWINLLKKERKKLKKKS